MTTWRAPQCRAIETAMMPIGPAPVMSTSSPTRLKARAVWVALPNGSRMEAISSSMAFGSLKTLDAGSVRYSANAPGRLTPTPKSVAAQVTDTAGAAIAAVSAGDVPFPGDPIAGFDTAHLAADLDDLAGVFVSHGHRHRDRLLRPGIPVEDVHVRAADGRTADLDENVVVADRGFRHVLHPDSGLRPSFDQCFQGASAFNE